MTDLMTAGGVLDLTFGGAGRPPATDPGCAAAVGAVLEALGKLAGPRKTPGRLPSGATTRWRRRAGGCSRPRWCPAGRAARPGAGKMTLAQLRALPGAFEAKAAWRAAAAARGHGCCGRMPTRPPATRRCTAGGDRARRRGRARPLTAVFVAAHGQASSSTPGMTRSRRAGAGAAAAPAPPGPAAADPRPAALVAAGTGGRRAVRPGRAARWLRRFQLPGGPGAGAACRSTSGFRSMPGRPAGRSRRTCAAPPPPATRTAPSPAAASPPASARSTTCPPLTGGPHGTAQPGAAVQPSPPDRRPPLGWTLTRTPRGPPPPPAPTAGARPQP